MFVSKVTRIHCVAFSNWTQVPQLPVVATSAPPHPIQYHIVQNAAIVVAPYCNYYFNHIIINVKQWFSFHYVDWQVGIKRDFWFHLVSVLISAPHRLRSRRCNDREIYCMLELAERAFIHPMSHIIIVMSHIIIEVNYEAGKLTLTFNVASCAFKLYIIYCKARNPSKLLKTVTPCIFLLCSDR